MKQLYIFLRFIFLSFKVYKYILFLYYAFTILKIIDALIKIKYSSYKLCYIGGHSYIIETPFFITPPPLIGTGIGESQN